MTNERFSISSEVNGVQRPAVGGMLSGSLFSPTIGAAAATLIGILAPILWGMRTGLTRGIVEDFGLAAGQFILYAFSTVVLFCIVGIPNLKLVPKRYLFFAMPLAPLTAIAFAFAIYFSEGGRQTLEAAMVNYLWPTLTVLFAHFLLGAPARWIVWPGMLAAFAGVVTLMSGDAGFSFTGFVERAASNPLAYGCTLVSATAWSLHSVLTRKWAEGTNLCTVVFAIQTVFYGILWLWGGIEAPAQVTPRGIASVVLGGIALGFAYAAWTQGMLRGRVTLLAIASYCTPVIATVFGIFWLDITLSASFWIGVALIVVGQTACSIGSRPKAPSEKEEPQTQPRSIGKRSGGIGR